MKVLLLWDTASELKISENDIKNGTGAYRPKLTKIPIYNPLIVNLYKTEWVSPITCWPFDDENQSEYIQEQTVKEGLESEVDDICFAKIDDNKISYKISQFGFSTPIELNEWTLIILDPKCDFKNPTYLHTENNLNTLMEDIKEYKIGSQNVYPNNMNLEIVKCTLDKEFTKLSGIATFFLLHNDKLVHTGKWVNKPYDYIMGNS